MLILLYISSSDNGTVRKYTLKLGDMNSDYAGTYSCSVGEEISKTTADILVLGTCSFPYSIQYIHYNSIIVCITVHYTLYNIVHCNIYIIIPKCVCVCVCLSVCLSVCLPVCAGFI